MHVPLIGCLNTQQLLPKGQGLRGCIWPLKIYAWTFMEISSCRRTRTWGECPPWGPQRHSFCGPSSIPGLHPLLFPLTIHNSEWVLSLKFGRAVILSLGQIDGHRLSEQVGTVDASHLGDILVGTLGKHSGVLFLLGALRHLGKSQLQIKCCPFSSSLPLWVSVSPTMVHKTTCKRITKDVVLNGHP